MRQRGSMAVAPTAIPVCLMKSRRVVCCRMYKAVLLAWAKSLFDDSVDLEAENKLVEEEKQAAINQDRDRTSRAASSPTRGRAGGPAPACALAIHEATLGEIGRENLEKHRQLDTEYANRMAENEQDLAKARQEWREAIDAARQKAPGQGGRGRSRRARRP